VPERCRCHQGAEPDRVGIAGQACQRRPGVRGPGQAIAVAHDEQVVRAKERRETTLLCLARDGELVGIRRALLGLNEQAQFHGGHSMWPPPAGTEPRAHVFLACSPTVAPPTGLEPVTCRLLTDQFGVDGYEPILSSSNRFVRIGYLQMCKDSD
jgi:hypothetical protein